MVQKEYLFTVTKVIEAGTEEECDEFANSMKRKLMNVSDGGVDIDYTEKLEEEDEEE